jgi:integrase
LAFDKYLDRFAAECLRKNWKASHEEVEAMLRKYALPVLKDKPLPDITRKDIKHCLKPVGDLPASTSKLFAVLRSLFNWAVSEDDLAQSPMAAMKAPPVPESRDRVLKDWEIKAVWQASVDLGYPFGPLVRLLILTGARRDEVSGMLWKELDKGQAVWALPASRAKNGNAVDIPLSSLAMVEIAAMAGTEDSWPRRGLLFTTTGKTPVSGYSRAKTRLDKTIEEMPDQAALEHWTFHDLRRTVATGMQRLGVRFEVTEAILNHVSGSRSGVAGIYQRHDWKQEKQTALQSWSDHIEQLLLDVDTTNVVPLASVRV